MKIVLDSGKKLNVARSTKLADLWEATENAFSVPIDRLSLMVKTMKILDARDVIGYRSIGTLITGKTVARLVEELELTPRQTCDLIKGICDLSAEFVETERLAALRVEAEVNAESKRVEERVKAANEAAAKVVQEAAAQIREGDDAAMAAAKLRAASAPVGTVTGRLPSGALSDWYGVKWADERKCIAQFANRSAAIAYRDTMLQATGGKISTALQVVTVPNPTNVAILTQDEFARLLATLHRFENKYPHLVVKPPPPPFLGGPIFGGPIGLNRFVPRY